MNYSLTPSICTWHSISNVETLKNCTNPYFFSGQISAFIWFINFFFFSNPDPMFCTLYFGPYFFQGRKQINRPMISRLEYLVQLDWEIMRKQENKWEDFFAKKEVQKIMRLSKFINDFNPLFCWSAGFPIGTLSNIPSEFHFGKNSVVSCLLTKNNTKLFRDS